MTTSVQAMDAKPSAALLPILQVIIVVYTHVIYMLKPSCHTLYMFYKKPRDFDKPDL